MVVDSDALIQIVETLWESLVGLPLERSFEAPASPDDAATITACVQVTGDSCGAVSLSFSEALAQKAAEAMFGAEPGETSPEEISDAVGELANVAGGNVKAMLGGDCQLSLPSVTSGLQHRLAIPGGELTGATQFTCEGEPLVVEVHASAVQECEVTR